MKKMLLEKVALAIGTLVLPGLTIGKPSTVSHTHGH